MAGDQLSIVPNIRYIQLPTGKIWHLFQLLRPEVRDLDRLLLHRFSLCRHTLLVGVLHHLFEILWVEGVEDIEEVFSWRRLAGRVLVRQVRHHPGVLLQIRVQGLHRDLLVVGHLDLLDLGLQQELLLAHEDILQEVFVDEVLGRQVKLEAI